MSTLLEQAIERIHAGDITTARSLLAQELKQNPRNERAWMASSYCVSDVKQKKYCLDQALEINPNNEEARRELGKLSSPPTSTLQTLTSTPKPSPSAPSPMRQAAPVAPPPAASTSPVKESTSTTQPSITVPPTQAPARVAAQPARQNQQTSNKSSINKNTRTQKKKGIPLKIWLPIVLVLIPCCGTVIAAFLGSDFISPIVRIINPLPDNFTISVHVADQSGNAVNGAKVLFFYPEGGLGQYTDSYGVSTFKVNNAGQGNLRVVVESDNYQVFEKQVLYPIETTVDVRLEEKEAINENVILRTVTEENKPIASSEIAVSIDGSIYRETTDSDGFAVLSLPFSDSGKIDARISVSAKGYDIQDQLTALTPGKLQYVLLAPTSLKVELPKILISNTNEVLSNPSSQGQTFDTTGAAVGSGVKISQESGGSGIKVVLLNPSSQPWEGVYIGLYEQTTDAVGNPSQGSEAGSGWINRQGEIDFNVEDGVYIACAGDVDGYGWTESGCVYNVQVNSSSLTKVILQVGQIKITVIDANGNPWEGVYCAAHTQKEDVSGNRITDRRVWDGWTDNTGVRYIWLTPGLYAIGMDLRGYNWGDLYNQKGQSGIPVQPGNTTPVLIEMGQIKVGLTDAAGKPRTGVYVEVITQKSDVNGKPVTADRVWDGWTDNGGIAAIDLTEGVYAIKIDNEVLYNVPVTWGVVTQYDGKTYQQIK